jgi:hypothetical protein
MTTSDVDRMQQGLHNRIGTGSRPPRRHVLIAAAAVLLVIVAVAAGTLWLRQPAPAVPAAPQGSQPLPGVSRVVDATGSSRLVALRADHTMTVYDTAAALVHPVPGSGGMSAWHVDGTVMIRDGADSQGRACRATGPWRSESDAVIVMDTAVLEGPGCTGASMPAATATRLSPGSDAAQNLADSGSEPAVPVTDPAQFNGVWLLRGTGLLWAVDELPNNAGGYLLDDDGDIDRAPDAQGKIELGPDGLLILTTSACDNPKFRHPVLHGTSARRSLTMTVEDDSCNWFQGNTSLTWIKVL